VQGPARSRQPGNVPQAFAAVLRVPAWFAMRLTLVVTLVLLASLLGVSTTATATSGPAIDPNQTCVGQPGAVAVCYTNGIAGPCVSAGVGLQGAYVCKRADGLHVCTSMNTALYGYCPTDLVDPTVSIVDPICIGKPDMSQTCVGHNNAGAICYSSSAGLQGAFACVYPDGHVRVCTSAYTALYGYCPTDLVIW
jgi:hypothetical protein